MKCRKIFFMFLILAAVLLTGCAGTWSEDGVSEHEDVVTQKLAGCSLSDEQMLDVIVGYFDIFTEVFQLTGEDIVVTVAADDGGVSVNTLRPKVDENGERTDELVEDKAVMRWNSVREAYAHLYEQELVDLEGNLTFEKDDIVAQMIAQESNMSVA